MTDSLNRFGATELFQLGKFLGILFLFAGFLVSIEVFREVRVPFTGITLGAQRRERRDAMPVPATSLSDGVGDADRGAQSGQAHSH